MTKNLSKFLVTITDINEKSFLIPYFPMGPLSLFISQRERKDQLQTDFSIIDKIVIILEIASAMKDLHFYCLIHWNLSCQNIFWNYD